MNELEKKFDEVSEKILEGGEGVRGFLKVTNSEDHEERLPSISEPMYFGPTLPYTINTENINNMNDVRHIVKLLDIRLSEDRARDLPLHLIKRVEDK